MQVFYSSFFCYSLTLIWQSHCSCSQLEHRQKKTLEAFANTLCMLAERPEKARNKYSCSSVQYSLSKKKNPMVAQTSCTTTWAASDHHPECRGLILMSVCSVQVVCNHEINLMHFSTPKAANLILYLQPTYQAEVFMVGLQCRGIIDYRFYYYFCFKTYYNFTLAA